MGSTPDDINLKKSASHTRHMRSNGEFTMAPSLGCATHGQRRERDPRDIGTNPFGHLVLPPGEKILSGVLANHANNPLAGLICIVGSMTLTALLPVLFRIC